MPCPHMGDLGPETFSRRGFVKAALAMGGTSALAACVDREGRVDAPSGTEDPSTLPDRQFEWTEYLPRGQHGNPKVPNHQLLLFLNYRGQGPPTDAERQQVDTALRALERAYQWGGGETFNQTATTGLLSLIGYSPAYFDRFDASLPDDLDLPPPETVLDELDEEASLAESYDALVLLTSDRVQVLLAAEQALRGTFDTLNGVPVEASFDGVFEFAERRTGFLGVGRPAEELDVDGVSENSPTAMGFRSSFRDNQASEDRVAIWGGPFDNGTTMQVSRLGLGLREWYDADRESRIEKMFSPEHTVDDVGEVGELLAGTSRVSENMANAASENAREYGRVGHTQKVAAARDEEFEPVILRRSEGVSIDLDRPSMNFLSVQRDMADFLETRKAMNGEHLDADVPPEEDGIRQFVEVLSRATFLVPPRPASALPTPNGGR
ncbi:DUF7405 family protein [Halosimplex amylolyticum]|uniref:DUF7405 family protein n=1 Tax=Halosimplex amylolyticum TaxID=3396616 RepID=UPI003F54B462